MKGNARGQKSEEAIDLSMPNKLEESFNISKYAQNTTLFLHVNWRPKLVIMTFEIFIHGQKCSGLPQTYICSTWQYE